MHLHRHRATKGGNVRQIGATCNDIHGAKPCYTTSSPANLLCMVVEHVYALSALHQLVQLYIALSNIQFDISSCRNSLRDTQAMKERLHGNQCLLSRKPLHHRRSVTYVLQQQNTMDQHKSATHAHTLDRQVPSVQLTSTI